MAGGESVYVDPSALVSLYLHQQDRSRRISAWRTRIAGALPITHHGRTEITNTLCRARYSGVLDDVGLDEALADFEADLAHGRLDQVNLLWRAALNRASSLSRRHTATLGTRSGDVLHVACAMELKLRRFVTFDERQGNLAVAAGLRLLRV